MKICRVFPVLGLVACGTVLLMGLGGCAMLDTLQLARPTASVAAAALKSIDLQAATLQFDIDVTNPYPVALPLMNLDYALASRGNSFLSGKAEALGSVSPGSTRRIPLLAKVTYLDLLKVLQDVRPGAVVPYAAELGLSVSAPEVGELRLPLRTEGKLPVPAVPDVEIAEIKWQKVDLREVTGLVMLNVVNRNQFPIDLSKITYALSLGDTQVADTSLAKRVSFASDGGAGMVEIPLSFSPERAGLGLLGLLAGKGSGYRLRGSLDLDTPFGPMSLPVDKVSKTVFRR